MFPNSSLWCSNSTRARWAALGSAAMNCAERLRSFSQYCRRAYCSLKVSIVFLPDLVSAVLCIYYNLYSTPGAKKDRDFMNQVYAKKIDKKSCAGKDT